MVSTRGTLVLVVLLAHLCHEPASALPKHAVLWPCNQAGETPAPSPIDTLTAAWAAGRSTASCTPQVDKLQSISNVTAGPDAVVAFQRLH